MDRYTVDVGSILAGRGRVSFQYGRAWIDKYEMTSRHRLLPRRMGQCRRDAARYGPVIFVTGKDALA
jgi:hypothetical protein